ncbi:MAG: hypothetical protein MUO94_01065 [Thermoplasmata archaeon]|nr:hypothetical protein [Thermoplasmata archaeon]
MKFLYCPQCKELRVKPWYSIRGGCSRCRGYAKEIAIPNTLMTYLVYACVASIFVLIYIYTSGGSSLLLYASIGALIATFILQDRELSRGRKYVMARIKPTKSDAKGFREKGWVKHEGSKKS